MEYMINFELPIVNFTKEQIEFRENIRSFLQSEKEKGVFETRIDSWLSGYDSDK